MNALLLPLVALVLASAEASLPYQCDQLCNCKTGPTFCAKVQSRLGPHQMQYPGCLNTCFNNCCVTNATLSEVSEGMCTDALFVEVVTGTHNGPVGLVEPCSGIYLAAVTTVKNGL